MNNNHNKIESVKINIGLSQLLITACLGLLTILGGGVIYLLKEENYNSYSYIPLILSVFSLLLSIYFGFIGISIARNNGFRGWWSTNSGRFQFNLQSILCISGVLFFLLTPLFIYLFPNNEINNNGNNQILLENEYVINFCVEIGPFETGKYKLNKVLEKRLLSKKSILEKSNAILVIGSSDKRPLRGDLRQEIGSNMDLATLRAESIKEFLVSEGITPEKVMTFSKGGINKDLDSYEKDRYVKIYISSNKKIAYFLE